MEYTYIYTLTDPITLKVKYVGKSNNPQRRFWQHCSIFLKNHKSNWIKSLIKKNKKPILKIIDRVLISEWEIWEKFWINIFKSKGYKLVNGTDGGKCASKSKKVAKKISDSKKGYKHTEETKKKISEARTGKPSNNPNILQQIKKARKSRTQETFNKISMSKLGKKRNSETIEKMKIALKGKKAWNKGKKMNTQYCKNIQKSRIKKKVAKLGKDNEIIEIFGSLTDAGKAMNTGYSNISNVCNGRLKTSSGFMWKFIEI